MSKPTPASVTDQTCTCNYLQNAADDPDNPIEFDARTSEYQFRYSGKMLLIYHCPFCGGAAPESKRDLLFERISEAEEERIADLLEGITTFDAAIKKFGKPDFESRISVKSPEREDQPPRIEYYREIRFHHLSDVADVWITERPDGFVYWQLQGKPKRRAKDPSAQVLDSSGPRPWWRFWS